MKRVIVVLMALYLLPMLFFMIVGGAAGEQGQRTEGTLLIIAAVVPMALLALSLWLLGRRGRSQFMSAAQGIDPRFVHFHDASGIAVDAKHRRLILANNNSIRTYGFDDVREHTCAWRTGGQSNKSGIGNLIRDAKNELDNREASGVFVWVKDIDHPEWRIGFRSKKKAQRWHEILQQALA